MNKRILTYYLASFLSCAYVLTATAQTKAKAISYSVDIYLEIYDPVYYAHTQSEDLVCHFEIDAYYTADRVRTIVRKLTAPIDYSVNFMPLLYDIKSADQHQIDHDNRMVITGKGNSLALNPTKNRKEILGYKCREYYFADSDGMYFSFWITEKPGDNICPIGNFSLRGTVLELIASNGVHCRATDMTEGEVENNFFDLPDGYAQQTVPEDGL
jgi:hypothetical protein